MGGREKGIMYISQALIITIKILTLYFSFKITAKLYSAFVYTACIMHSGTLFNWNTDYDVLNTLMWYF